jgi:nucleotide-binding universal stress UspA family protein
MKKIVLPTDFSENSWNAIKYALQLFKNKTCTFYILNTYTPVIYHVDYLQVSSAQFGLADAMKESSLKGLETIKTKIKDEFNNPKHTFSQISAFNSLISEIKELFEGNVMDFIVMGTKGATGAKEVLLGTNTVQVIKNIKCPIIAVPDYFDFETPLEILFPSDYGIYFKDEHIKPILDIATTYHSRINILHVINNSGISEQQEQNRQKLESYFKKSAHLFHNVRHKNIPEAIADFQLKARVNLLVMINNKHSFFENLFFKSTINQIGFHISVPFLVIPSSTKKNRS